MGETVDQTLTEIETTRAQLERDIDDLFERLPEREQIARQAKTYGGAAAGAALFVGIVVLRVRAAAERKARRTEARINAEELARAFSPHMPPSEDEDGGSSAGVVALLVAAAALVLSVLNAVRGRAAD